MPPKTELQPDALSEDRPAQGGGIARPPAVLVDEAAFAAALEALAAVDAVLVGRLRELEALPRLRRREPGFAGLAAIIVSQQVSTASANAIFGRLQARFPALCAADILAAGDDDLRLCGLSAPKMRTLRAIATAVDEEALDFARLAVDEADVAHTRLCAIKGIGPWTADIFLLFCLGHADAWPAGDLALQEGARLLLDLEARPDARALTAIGERWRPLRGVVAHCLWAYYTAMRGRPGTLGATSTRAVAGGSAKAAGPAPAGKILSPAGIRRTADAASGPQARKKRIG